MRSTLILVPSKKWLMETRKYLSHSINEHDTGLLWSRSCGSVMYSIWPSFEIFLLRLPTCFQLVIHCEALLVFPCESKRELLVAWSRFKHQQFMLQLSLPLKHDGSKQYLTGSYTTLLLAPWTTERNLCNMFISTRWFMSSCYIQINTVHSLPLGSDTQVREGYMPCSQAQWWRFRDTKTDWDVRGNATNVLMFYLLWQHCRKS